MNAHCECGAMATWRFEPTDSYGEWCDDCVPRGCSCNRSFNEATSAWDGPEDTDERGRLLPCVEIDFHEDGFAHDQAKVDRLASRIDARRGETRSGSISEADESLTAASGDAQPPVHKKEDK